MKKQHTEEFIKRLNPKDCKENILFVYDNIEEIDLFYRRILNILNRYVNKEIKTLVTSTSFGIKAIYQQISIDSDSKLNTLDNLLLPIINEGDSTILRFPPLDKDLDLNILSEFDWIVDFLNLIDKLVDEDKIKNFLIIFPISKEGKDKILFNESLIGRIDREVVL